METSDSFLNKAIGMIDVFTKEVVDSLLNGDLFALTSTSTVGLIFAFLVIWELSDIILKNVESGVLDTKRLIHFIICVITVLMVHGIINPSSFPGMNLYDKIPSSYHYKGKPDLLRHSHSIGRAIFDGFGASLNQKTINSSSFITARAERNVLMKQACDKENDKTQCYKNHQNKSTEELEKIVYPPKDCGMQSFGCDIDHITNAIKAKLSFEGITVLLMMVLGYIKMVFIVLIYLVFSLTVVLAIFGLKIISMFLVLSKTRSDIIGSYKYMMSTTAFYFAISLVRFIISSATLAVAKSMDSAGAGADSYIIGGVFALVLMVGEVGLLWFIPQLTSSLFNLQLSVLTKLADSIKSTLQTTATIIGGVATGGALAVVGSKLAGSNAMSATGSKIKNAIKRPFNKGNNTPGSNFSGSNASSFNGGGSNNMSGGNSGISGAKDIANSVTAKNADVQNSNQSPSYSPKSPGENEALKKLEKAKLERQQKSEGTKSTNLPKNNIIQESAKVESKNIEEKPKATRASDLIRKNREATESKKIGVSNKLKDLTNPENISKVKNLSKKGVNVTAKGLKASAKGAGVAAVGLGKAAGMGVSTVLKLASADSSGSMASLIAGTNGKLKNNIVNPQKQIRERQVEKERFSGDGGLGNWGEGSTSDLFDRKQHEESMLALQEAENASSSLQSEIKELEIEKRSFNKEDLEYHKKEQLIEEKRVELSKNKEKTSHLKEDLDSHKGNWEESISRISPESISTADYEKIKSVMDDGVIDAKEKEMLEQILGDKKARTLYDSYMNNMKKADDLISKDMAEHGGRITNKTINKVNKISANFPHEKRSEYNRKMRLMREKQGKLKK